MKQQDFVRLGAALWLCFLLTSNLAAAARPPPPAGSQQQPRFGSTYEAVMALNSTKVFKDVIVSFLAPGLSKDLVQRYQYILPIVQSGGSTLTAFVPTNEAMQEAREYMCMTVPEMENYTASNPEMVLTNTEMQLANTPSAVYSSDFKDGQVLPTFKAGFSLVIKKKVDSDGNVKWVLPGMNQNDTDITIVQTDIPAGNAVVHLIDGVVVSKGQKERNKKMRQQLCGRRLNSTAAEGSSKHGDRGAGAAPGIMKSGAVGLKDQLWWSIEGRGSGLALALGAAIAAVVL